MPRKKQSESLAVQVAKSLIPNFGATKKSKKKKKKTASVVKKRKVRVKKPLV